MTYKLPNKIIQFFEELKSTNQIKSYEHSCDDYGPEVLSITFNSGATIHIENYGAEENYPLTFQI
jgi:hypothetical protein